MKTDSDFEINEFKIAMGVISLASAVICAAVGFATAVEGDLRAGTMLLAAVPAWLFVAGYHFSRAAVPNDPTPEPPSNDKESPQWEYGNWKVAYACDACEYCVEQEDIDAGCCPHCGDWVPDGDPLPVSKCTCRLKKLGDHEEWEWKETSKVDAEPMQEPDKINHAKAPSLDGFAKAYARMQAVADHEYDASDVLQPHSDNCKCGECAGFTPRRFLIRRDSCFHRNMNIGLMQCPDCGITARELVMTRSVRRHADAKQSSHCPHCGELTLHVLNHVCTGR